MYYGYVSPDYLCHYGVQGMHWGQHLMAKYELSRAGKSLRKNVVRGSMGVRMTAKDRNRGRRSNIHC